MFVNGQPIGAECCIRNQINVMLAAIKPIHSAEQMEWPIFLGVRAKNSAWTSPAEKPSKTMTIRNSREVGNSSGDNRFGIEWNIIAASGAKNSHAANTAIAVCSLLVVRPRFNM